MKIKSAFPPPDPDRNRPKTHDLLREMTLRTLPRGRGGPRTELEIGVSTAKSKGKRSDGMPDLSRES